MLRSFNYARWSALRNISHGVEEPERVLTAARDWELATRKAFMDAYVGTMGASTTAAPVNADLLALFELEKALYELRYEINNRHDWAQVPIQGILALLDPDTAR